MAIKTKSTTTLSCGRCTKKLRVEGTKQTAMRKAVKAGWGTEVLTGKNVNPLAPAGAHGDPQDILEVMLCPKCVVERAITSGDYDGVKDQGK